jgi:tyrosine-protein kinase Etk/Wzc
LSAALLIPKTYTASARILPPAQSNSVATAVMGQLGPLGGLAARDLGVKNPADTFVTMIRSRTVADAIIQRFHLLDLYRKTNMVDARKALDGRLDVGAGKDGTISISVDDQDPRRAADMANQIVTELYGVTQRLALTESSQRRGFFERELTLARDALTNAEAAMRRFQEKSGVLQLDSQAKVMIETVAALRAAVNAKDLEIRSMTSFATEANPAIVRARSELAEMKSQYAANLRKTGGGEGDVLVPTGRLPAAGMEYVVALREFKYREGVFELIAKQLESAKLDEAQEPTAIQVIDVAVVPDKPSSPKRSLILIAALLTGVLFGCWLAVCMEAMQRRPETRRKLSAAGRYLWHRR